jgi:hypothetical protein
MPRSWLAVAAMVTQSRFIGYRNGEQLSGADVQLKVWAIALLAVGSALGGCALPDLDSFRAPTAEALFRPLSVTNVRDRVLPPVTPDEFVDASGRCAAAAPPMASADSAAAPQQAAITPSAGAIALEMTECDVVKRAGLPERVEIGSNDRNERTATLSYLGGPRPGIYAFVDGRLRSMERAPEQPAQAKPAKKPVKPAARPPRQAEMR